MFRICIYFLRVRIQRQKGTDTYMDPHPSPGFKVMIFIICSQEIQTLKTIRIQAMDSNTEGFRLEN